MSDGLPERACQLCGGGGEIRWLANPPDPQTEESAPCPECAETPRPSCGRDRMSDTDLILGDVDHYVWSPEGWENAALGSIADARTTSRGQAAAFFASETGNSFPDVRVWKRYVRCWTRQDAWEHSGRERWAEARDVEEES